MSSSSSQNEGFRILEEFVCQAVPDPSALVPPQVVNFHKVGDAYGEFSNFAAYPVTLDGSLWPTSEHYFQAQKFEDGEYRERIRKTNSAMQAARLGRDRNKKLRADWESAKIGVMQPAVLAKFAQHEDLRALLLSTGNAKIVEHTKNDDYWGDGGNGTGRNMLGRILMEVRESLRESAGGR